MKIKVFQFVQNIDTQGARKARIVGKIKNFKTVYVLQTLDRKSTI